MARCITGIPAKIVMSFWSYSLFNWALHLYSVHLDKLMGSGKQSSSWFFFFFLKFMTYVCPFTNLFHVRSDKLDFGNLSLCLIITVSTNPSFKNGLIVLCLANHHPWCGDAFIRAVLGHYLWSYRLHSYVYLTYRWTILGLILVYSKLPFMIFVNYLTELIW